MIFLVALVLTVCALTSRVDCDTTGGRYLNCFFITLDLWLFGLTLCLHGDYLSSWSDTYLLSSTSRLVLSSSNLQWVISCNLYQSQHLSCSTTAAQRCVCVLQMTPSGQPSFLNTVMAPDSRPLTLTRKLPPMMQTWKNSPLPTSPVPLHWNTSKTPARQVRTGWGLAPA